QGVERLPADGRADDLGRRADRRPRRDAQQDRRLLRGRGRPGGREPDQRDRAGDDRGAGRHRGRHGDLDVPPHVQAHQRRRGRRTRIAERRSSTERREALGSLQLLVRYRMLVAAITLPLAFLLGPDEGIAQRTAALLPVAAALAVLSVIYMTGLAWGRWP